MIRLLAVLGGVGWWLLWLTTAARATPEAPGTVVFDDDTWQALAARTSREPLPTAPPTLRTVVRQIARLGGFLGRKSDGEPGVQTLWRGLSRLPETVATWRAAKRQLTADGSV